MPGTERHTKYLTNVWAHQVFKCLAYVDTMRVMNTKMLADMQRKLLNFKLSIIVVYFEEIPNYLKCPRYQTKWYPIEKANTQLNEIAWVFNQLTWKPIILFHNSTTPTNVMLKRTPTTVQNVQLVTLFIITPWKIGYQHNQS